MMTRCRYGQRWVQLVWLDHYFFNRMVWPKQLIVIDIFLSKTIFLPALWRRGVDINAIWFQQDGATPHTAGHVLKWLKVTFGRNFILFKSDTVWPPHSLDLSSLDFFLWGHLKDNVGNPKPDTFEQLKSAIHREIRKITPVNFVGLVYLIFFFIKQNDFNVQ
jgi:hypothetical protein